MSAPGLGRVNFHTARVTTRKTQIEHIESALAPKSGHEVDMLEVHPNTVCRFGGAGDRNSSSRGLNAASDRPSAALAAQL
jgi:hypothetical protein